MHTKIFLSISFLCVISFSSIGQKNLNDTIQPDYWIQQTSENQSREFKIIDFWFTRCAPCIYTMPHLNELHSQFEGQIEFLSITFEKVDEVNKFLSHHPIDFPIGLDTTKRIINFFDIYAYPTTLLMKDDSVLWRGYPNLLTSDLITHLTGYNPYYTNVQSSYSNITIENQKNNLKITRNEYMSGKSAGSQVTEKEIFFVNKSLSQIFSQWLQVNEHQILSKDSNTYDIRYLIPKEHVYSKMDGFIDAVMDKLNLSVTYEDRTLDGFELSIVDDSLLFVNRSNYQFTSRSVFVDSWKGKNVTISDLVFALENEYDIYISSHSGHENFGYDIAFTLDGLDQVITDLEKEYGIRLIPKKISKPFYKIY